MIAKGALVDRLRECNYKHKRQAPRVDLWRQAGTGTIVSVPRCDLIPVVAARAILFQAGLGATEIEAFFNATASVPPEKRGGTETPVDTAAVVAPSLVDSTKERR